MGRNVLLSRLAVPKRLQMFFRLKLALEQQWIALLRVVSYGAREEARTAKVRLVELVGG